MSKTKYKKQNKRITNNQAKVFAYANLSRKSKQRKRNEQLRDPDSMPHKLYHPNQQQYAQHPFLWIVLNISTIVLGTKLIGVQSQHPIKSVGLTIHSETFLVRNSDKIKYKMQKPCNENSHTCIRLRGSLKGDQFHLPQSLIA